MDKQVLYILIHSRDQRDQPIVFDAVRVKLGWSEMGN